MQTVSQSTNKPTTNMNLGLVAGEGKLPAILINAAKAKGYRVVALALSDIALNGVEQVADKSYSVGPGQLGRSLKLFRQEKVEDVVFIGKVPKINLLQNVMKLDWIAIRELSKLTDFSDDSIQRLVGDWVETQGIRVRTQAEFLKELFADYGVITKRQPNAAEYADIQYGMKVAKEIARLNIGQTVVVRDQMILAVEGIEGTDECIRRAVKLARGPVVVCKVAKSNHDLRFDTPTVGMTTLEAMLGEHQGGVLAVGANETLVVEKEALAEYAESKGIAIIAV